MLLLLLLLPLSQGLGATVFVVSFALAVAIVDSFLQVFDNKEYKLQMTRKGVNRCFTAIVIVFVVVVNVVILVVVVFTVVSRVFLMLARVMLKTT